MDINAAEEKEIDQKWCKEGGKKVKSMQIYSGMELRDARWTVKNSLHWSGLSIYLCDYALTNINT